MNLEKDIELFKIDEFAHRLLVSRTTVFQWIKSGKLKAGYHFIKIGRCLRFFWELDVIRSLHENRVIETEIVPRQITKCILVTKSKKKTIINMNY